jgi:uncharacterized protein (DUF433 family)
MSDYVTKLKNGAYRIAGTRISLDSIVYAYKRGELPEQIVQSFPLLTLEQVHGAIAFYLSNSEMIDEYLEQGEIEFEKKSREWQTKNPELHARFAKLRQEMKQKI